MQRHVLQALACVLILSRACSLAAGDKPAAVAPLVLQQIISCEDPKFNCARASLTIGRDGMVYLTSVGQDSGYILRVSRDGRDKLGGASLGAIHNATADAAGTIAASHAHFSHQVAIYDKEFQKLHAVTDFLVSDQVSWDAPGGVEAGAGGDFYGLDQHRDRIVQLDAGGKVVRAYALPHVERCPAQAFRVCEKAQAFYVVYYGKPEVQCLGFDGRVKWERSLGVGANTYEGDNGGFDVDPDGVLFTIGPQESVLRKTGPDGKPAGEVRLSIPPERKLAEGIHRMRLWGTEAVLRGRYPSELFQVYDLSSGALKRSVSIDHERLSVSAQGGPWIAGQPVSFKIEFDGGGRPIKPRWRVWARPFGVLDYRELQLSGGKLLVPADLAGLYQIKVTPESTPWQHSAAASEYQVETLVEVRRAGAQGSAAGATPLGRVYFGRGEEIPLTIYMRGNAPTDTELTITLRDGSQTLAMAKAKFDPAGKEIRFTLPKWLTNRLRPGNYVFDVAGNDLTCVAQPLAIGPGTRSASLLTVVYGDYGPTYPQANVWDAPDIVTASARRTERLGFNLMVDRLGHPLQMGAFSLAPPRVEVAEFVKRLEADPCGLPPEKLASAPALLQAMSGYSASGISQMAILMSMDAGLPLGGPGFDSRTPEQDVKDLAATTEALKAYPAFRGWSWAANWWVFAGRGAAAARTAEEKAACAAALKKAAASGAWDDVLDRVAGYRLSYAVDAQAMFNHKLQELAPGRVSAVASPFRNVESYPPVTLANVDESDLQAQWEQIALPYHGPFSVDFYKRPGHRAWGHPEVWNDAGSGDQVLSTLWQMVMRGADGVGCSGPVPPWHFAVKGNTDDPRLSWNGTTSVYRNLNAVLRAYGPWILSMHNHDKVAIVASGRMYKIDDWVGATGRHFGRVMEAYVACLHAHRPASIVFTEDLRPDTLKHYEAVLVVGQSVEMEPALASALQAAQRAGAAVFADGTCRAELVEDFVPLGLSFDHWEKDPSLAADDHAYWRTAGYAKAAAPALAKALAAVRPAVEIENPEVFISERRAEQGRYLFVVNNSTFGDLEPGYLWRVTLACASLVPQVVPLKIEGIEGRAIYDVFAGKQVQPVGGMLQADCRNMPARVFAILPAAVARVRVKGPEGIARGKALRWEVEVQDGGGKAIAAAVPVCVRLLAADGAVLDEQYVSAASKGAGGEFILPLNAPAGPVAIDAVELLSGKAATLNVAVADAKSAPLDLLHSGDCPDFRSTKMGLSPSASSTASAAAPGDFSPVDESFGPHVRDLVVTDGGSLAVMNTMNWDHNLYAVDVETGTIRWRQRAGHYFAFEPTALPSGVAVQGFDLRSAQGYHLYLVGADGRLERRFALYGLPQRLPHRFVPALVRDHVNSFAAGPDGKWVASSGDLGVAVWTADGKLLWRHDWFDQRHSGKLLALDRATLLVIEGTQAAAYGASDGKPQWQQPLGRSGEIRIARTSADSKTAALYNIADGGRLYVLREGQIVRVIPTAAEDFSLSADGSLVAVVTEDLLKLYSLADGLQWIFHGDDLLHFPRFSRDGRLAVSSSLGTVYATDLEGRAVLERDVKALAVPAWLADGSLLLATWEGTVCRLDKRYARQWQTRLTPEAPDMRGKILADDAAPTTAAAGWSNAAEQPAGLSPNLLAKTTPLIRLVTSQGPTSLTETPGQKVAMLYDGKTDAPAEAWIPWHIVGTFAETSPLNYILIDAFRTQMKVAGVTLVEDPAHPESWLRDARIDYWDAAREQWVPIQPLRSDAAVHTHMFARPVEAARFRLVLPWGVCGNTRLAESVFHGEVLGCSHPDVVAKRPLAILFDEQEDIRQDLYAAAGGLAIALEGAYSGGRCLTLTPPVAGQAAAGPPWQQQFGHTTRNWDFEIVENPQPGQYRWLQFAWKALAPETKGMTLKLSDGGYGGYAIAAGEPTAFEGATVAKRLDSPPAAWRTVRLDLWAAAKKPWRVRSLALGVKGGPAAFDQIVLGRTEQDLPAEKR
jgi:outer membrane protein assembly factor BamB